MHYIPEGQKAESSHKSEGSLEAVSGSMETLRDTLKDVAASYAAVAASAVLIRKFANDEESNAS